MKHEAERAPLSRPLKVDELKDGASGVIEASEAEMASIARLLDLVRLAGLSFAYRLNHGGGGRLRLTGQLKADVTQTCVVSLDPVDAHLDVPVEAAFWPDSLLEEFEAKAEQTANHELVDWPEPIEDGKIDLGPLIYESLATALEPYPRRQGASFDWSQGKAEEAERAKTGPFAALAALKRR
jgi:uncharacterized metal-binding protein YceD (DUF177 family)